jgi:hypothetical protein
MATLPVSRGSAYATYAFRYLGHDFFIGLYTSYPGFGATINMVENQDGRDVILAHVDASDGTGEAPINTIAGVNEVMDIFLQRANAYLAGLSAPRNGLLLAKAVRGLSIKDGALVFERLG